MSHGTQRKEIPVKTLRRLPVIVCVIALLAIIWFQIPGEDLILTAEGTTFYVGGLGPQNYTTVQEAVDNANPEDMVYIYEGTYFENIIINKSIYLTGENKDTTVIDGGSNGDVVHVTADSVTITGFTITNSGSDWGDTGIELHITQDCHINNNIVSKNYFGIFFHYSSENNDVSNNEISSNYADGVYLTHSDGNIIRNNNVFENDHGVQISNSSTNVIAYNIISNNDGDGINLKSSNNNRIENNTVLYNDDGIYLNSCGDNVIEKNTLLNNEEGIQISYSANNVVNSNSVLDNDYGIHLESSSDNTIINNEAIYNKDGINIEYSDNIILTNNYALDNTECGIKITHSDGNIMAYNIISANRDDGIIVESSDESAIDNNNILENGDDGIELFSSAYSIITNNTVSANSEYGIYLWEFSNNNRIYHNNIISNKYQAFDNTIDSNQWDNGYLSGGNYWSNYIGGDKKSGSNQDLYGGDGIGDVPFAILAGAGKDRYPLMRPFLPPPLFETNDPPSCNITTPPLDAEISSIFAVTGSALDSDGMIERVEVKIDEGEWIRAIGTAPWNYDLDTTTLADGDHKIYVRSYDGMDYSTELRVDVMVDNSVPEKSIFEEDLFWLVIFLLIVIIVLVVILAFAKKSSSKSKPVIEEENTIAEEEHEIPNSEEEKGEENIKESGKEEVKDELERKEVEEK